MDFLGGASGICAGGMLIEGSKLQKELGVTDDTPEKFIEDMLANGKNLNNKPTLEVYAKNVGPTVDWLIEQGVKLQTQNGVQKRAEFKTPRLLLLKGGCPGYAQTLRELVGKSGAKVMLSTRAEELIIKDGKVVGVKASGDGKRYTIGAKAVIMASGGYGANRGMLEGNLKHTLYYGPVSSTGDGHKMVMKAGAKMQLMPYAKIYYNGLEVAPGIAKSTLTGNAAALSIGAIMVDKNGMRVVNEKGTGRSIVTAQSAAPGGQLYLVMDEPTFAKFRVGIKNNGVSPEEVDKWLAANGKGTPLFAHGATLAEAAKNAGINAENLAASVKRYNGFVAAGKDEDFGRKAENMKAAISDKGPYYIVEQKPRFATTMGSVTLNDKMQVLDQSGKVIPNLYAAGEIGNSVHGDDSAPAANVSWVATSAKLASDAAVKAIK
jgi:fumarate reductase flavoprotein subunit